MTSDEVTTLKATLLKDMEGEIDRLVAARSAKEQLTLTEIEEVVLEARQRLGQRPSIVCRLACAGHVPVWTTCSPYAPLS
jgi:hypothetical protein